MPELLVGGVNTETLDPALRPAAPGGDVEADTIELLLQTRDQKGRICTTEERVDPKKVGIIAVDCWHYHWCRTWRNRAGSLIPRFNYCINAARKLGMTLVFSPTNAMRDLHESPQRRATLQIVRAWNKPFAFVLNQTPIRGQRIANATSSLGDEAALDL